MNKLLFLLFPLFITINVFAANHQVAANDSLHLSVQEQEFIRKHPVIRFSDVQWEPFSNTSEKKYSGIFRDYYDEIEKISGLKFKFIPVGNGINFQTVLNALRDKKIDMIDGTGKTQERKKYALFAGPFMQVSLGIASTRDHLYTTLQSLTSKRVAIASGSTAIEVIKQEFPLIKIYQTQSPDEGLKLLSHRKVDAIIDNLVVIDYALQKNGDSNLQVIQIDDYDFKIYSLIRNDYFLLQSIIQKSIDFIRSQREIKIKNTIIKDALYRPIKQVSLSALEQYYLSQKKEITMCVDPDWEPFEIINSAGKHEGIAADLIALVAQRTGLNIKLIQTKTWEETLQNSKSGKCDLLSFLNQTPERDKWLTFTQPLISDPNILITREEHPFITDLHALKNETMALPFGTAMMERLSKDFPNLKFISVVSETDAMRMVSEKKADMTVRSLIVAAYTIKKEGWFNLKISGQPLGYENFLRMGVVKDQAILRDILDKGIQTLTPIEREEIINKHTGLVVNTGIDYKTISIIVIGLLSVIGFIALLNYMLKRKIRLEVAKNLQLKEQYYQRAKEAEIGSLIANISHQWREPLSRLSSLNLLMMAKLKRGMDIKPEELVCQSEEIEETIDFMSQTMQNFLVFYKKSEMSTEFSILKSIRDSLNIIETKILDHHVTINIDGSEEILMRGIKNEWMQVWLNLINNAIDVFSAKQIKDAKITITIEATQVHICDNGGGIDFTKKSNGLGHLMCHDIVAKYEASLEFKNSAEGLCAMIKFNTKD